jgi:hypothetical protein
MHHPRNTNPKHNTLPNRNEDNPSSQLPPAHPLLLRNTVSNLDQDSQPILILSTRECILLSMLDVPCGCPTVVPTHTSYTSCPKHCAGGCGTAYRTNLASCPTSSPTSVR